MTVFNERFPFAVVRQHYSSRGHLVREVVVAACADRSSAMAAYQQMRRDNPNESFSFHQVC